MELRPPPPPSPRCNFSCSQASPVAPQTGNPCTHCSRKPQLTRRNTHVRRSTLTPLVPDRQDRKWNPCRVVKNSGQNRGQGSFKALHCARMGLIPRFLVGSCRSWVPIDNLMLPRLVWPCGSKPTCLASLGGSCWLGCSQVFASYLPVRSNAPWAMDDEAGSWLFLFFCARLR